MNENLWLEYAKKLSIKLGKRVVVITDRGLVGQAAYFGSVTREGRLQELNELLKTFGTNVEEARAHYTGIVYLVTAAHGAEEFYTLENNPARYEKTPEMARATCDRTLSAWLGHPHLAVIANIMEGRRITFQ